MDYSVRSAAADDRTAVVDLVEQAYQPWVAVIGVRPVPMDADYAELIAAGRSISRFHRGPTTSPD